MKDIGEQSVSKPASHVRRLRKRVALLGLVVLVGAGIVLEIFPIGIYLSPPIYLIVVLALAASYTVTPFLRDNPAPVLVWPGAMLLFGGVALWSLFAGAVNPPWVIALAPLLIVLATIVLVKRFLTDLGRDQLSYFHPLLLKALVSTRPTRDEPAVFEMAFDSSMFPKWVLLARFLRRERLADFVHLTRKGVTIRLVRVNGLSRLGALLALPFGRTTIRLGARGRATVSVDPHVYRLLERPGPYEAYCLNLVRLLDEMAADISEGKRAQARRLALASPL